MVQVGAIWQCLVCKGWSHSKGKLETKGCKGSVAKKWKRREVSAILKSVEPGTEGSRVHRRMYSGEVVWCSVCGCYAEHKARGLAEVCEGKFQGIWKGGGREGQRRDLLANKHPKTGKPLPPAVTESQWMAGVRPALMVHVEGEQPSMPEFKLCRASSCILDRIRAAKRQADREATSSGEAATSAEEVAQLPSSSSIARSGEACSKRRRIIGKATPSIVGGTTIERREPG